MRKYSPRRASNHWLDSDCPDGVLAIFDHPNSADRYTVFYRDPIEGDSFSNMIIWYRGMSENPFHPQGVGIYGEMKAHEVSMYRYRNKHRMAKWSTLPDRVKDCVRQDLASST